MAEGLRPDGSGDGVAVLSPGVRWRRADNPGPMTLEGTNSYLLGRPGGRPLLVDPGPLAPRAETTKHREALLAAAGGALGGIVLTHRHLDHSESAAGLAAQLGVAVHAVDPTLRMHGSALAEGAALVTAGVEVSVVATPGHTSDSVSLLVRDGAATYLLTGDTVLGRGTTVMTYPDGDVGAYLSSLARLQAVVRAHPGIVVLPGHGPAVERPAERLADYVTHRQTRLDQVRSALSAGATTAAEVVDRVYADVDPTVRSAALQSVEAQLRYLRGPR